MKYIYARARVNISIVPLAISRFIELVKHVSLSRKITLKDRCKRLEETWEQFESIIAIENFNLNRKTRWQMPDEDFSLWLRTIHSPNLVLTSSRSKSTLWQTVNSARRLKIYIYIYMYFKIKGEVRRQVYANESVRRICYKGRKQNSNSVWCLRLRSNRLALTINEAGTDEPVNRRTGIF